MRPYESSGHFKDIPVCTNCSLWGCMVVHSLENMSYPIKFRDLLHGILASGVSLVMTNVDFSFGAVFLFSAVTHDSLWWYPSRCSACATNGVLLAGVAICASSNIACVPDFICPGVSSIQLMFLSVAVNPRNRPLYEWLSSFASRLPGIFTVVRQPKDANAVKIWLETSKSLKWCHCNCRVRESVFYIYIVYKREGPVGGANIGRV